MPNQTYGKALGSKVCSCNIRCATRALQAPSRRQLRTRKIDYNSSERQRKHGSCTAQASSPEAAPMQRPQRKIQEDWEQLKALQANGEDVEITISKVNGSGGTFVLHGVEGFLPYSNMDFSRVPPDNNGAALEYLEGKSMKVKLTTVDPDSRKLYGSELAVLAQQLATQLKKDEIVEGVVSHCTDYGAFVKIGSGKSLQGVGGMIHISELSWNYILTPEAVVQPGMFVRCKVISTDPKAGRISLSLKRMEPDPLEERLETVLPAEDREQMAFVPTEVPSTIEEILTVLAEQPGVKGVSLGRQAEEKRAVSQDLEIWMSTSEVADGFALVARAGRLLQEIKVTTTMSKEEVKRTTQNVLKQLAK